MLQGKPEASPQKNKKIIQSKLIHMYMRTSKVRQRLRQPPYIVYPPKASFVLGEPLKDWPQSEGKSWVIYANALHC